jgi:hypothetical protein
VRWEYRVEYESSLTNYSKRDLQAGLNALGADAWELIAMESSSTSRQGMFIFRRPLAGQPKPEMKPAPEKALKEKAEPQLELRLYPLKFADVHELSQLINSVLRDRPIRLAAEPRTNQLIVNATMESHGQIQMLLERLDIPMDTDKAKPSKKGR